MEFEEDNRTWTSDISSHGMSEANAYSTELHTEARPIVWVRVRKDVMFDKRLDWKEAYDMTSKRTVVT